MRAARFVPAFGLAIAAVCPGQVCTPHWSSEFESTSGLDGPATASIVYDDGSGTALYVAGGFTHAGGVAAAKIARWDGTSWSAVGAGLGGGALALAPYDDGTGMALYATSGAQSGVSKWNGAAWSTLPGTTNAAIWAAQAFGSGKDHELYIGGRFTTAGSVAASGIARWNGTRWAPVGTGITGGTNATVVSMVVLDDGTGEALYAGGSFLTAGGVSSPGIAKWTGTSWLAVPTPPSSGTFAAVALAAFDDGTGPALHASGNFRFNSSNTGQARLQGAIWSRLGAAFTYVSNDLRTLDLGAGPRLVAAGRRSTGQPGWISSWDGQAWTPIGDVIGTPETLSVLELAGNPVLYAAGSLAGIGAAAATNIAAYDGSWSSLGEPPRDTSGAVRALFPTKDGVYVGGGFTAAGNAVAEQVALYTPPMWNAVGAGFHGETTWSTYSEVLVFQEFDDGTGAALFAGGSFNRSGSQSTGGVARWDGQQWRGVGGGFRVQNITDSGAIVTSMAVMNVGGTPLLFAAGMFDHVDQGPRRSIARWDGAVWSDVDGGVGFAPSAPSWPAYVASMVPFDDGSGPALYVCGEFAEAGGVPAQGLARWREGQAWSALPPLDPEFIWLAVHNGALYLAANSYQTNLGSVFRLAAGWVPVGPAFNAGLSTIASIDSGAGPALYAGGAFTVGGGRGVARWEGSQWNPLGPGVAGKVYTLAADVTQPGSILIGGAFTSSGGGLPGRNIARWVHCACYPDCNADGALNLTDFGCFQTKFALGDAYADCNGDSSLNLADVGCFTTKFALGCP